MMHEIDDNLPCLNDKIKNIENMTVIDSAGTTRQAVNPNGSQLTAEDLIRGMQEYIESLHKIIKRKSNQDRKLRPSKEHPGYIVLTKKEFINKKGQKIYIYTIQTAWPTFVPYNEILADSILVDLKKNLGVKELKEVGVNWPVKMNDNFGEYWVLQLFSIVPLDVNKITNPT